MSISMLLHNQSTERAAGLLARVTRHEPSRFDPPMQELFVTARILALTVLGRLDAATDAIEGHPGATSSQEALTRLVIDGCLAPLEAMVLDAELRGDEGAQHVAAELLLRVIGAEATKSLPPTRARRRAQGIGLLFAGQPEAAQQIFQRLIEEQFDFRINTWRAEALRAIGQDEAAFALYRTVVQRLETDGEVSDPDYWRCWSRMLGILGAQEATARNDEVILVQINRLKLIDPALGGDPHKRRIERIERTIKPTAE